MQSEENTRKRAATFPEIPSSYGNNRSSEWETLLENEMRKIYHSLKESLSSASCSNEKGKL